MVNGRPNRLQENPGILANPDSNSNGKKQVPGRSFSPVVFVKKCLNILK